MPRTWAVDVNISLFIYHNPVIKYIWYLSNQISDQGRKGAVYSLVQITVHKFRCASSVAVLEAFAGVLSYLSLNTQLSTSNKAWNCGETYGDKVNITEHMYATIKLKQNVTDTIHLNLTHSLHDSNVAAITVSRKSTYSTRFLPSISSTLNIAVLQYHAHFKHVMVKFRYFNYSGDNRNVIQDQVRKSAGWTQNNAFSLPLGTLLYYRVHFSMVMLHS